MPCETSFAAPPLREAPNPAAAPANQLLVAGNACGPAALLNAFRFGAPHWQRVSAAVKGDDDRARILTIIREIGMRPSKHLPGRARWSRQGVGLSDLRDMGNEMIMGHALPQLAEEVFFLKPRETPEKLLRRVHKRLDTSLAKGFPPVLSLRRHALRTQPGKPAQWVVIDAHFVTLTAIPHSLEKNPRSFPVRYIDPWGGRHCEGVIRIPGLPLLAGADGTATCLEAVFPETKVGLDRVRRGDTSALVLSAAIGRW
ncbi:MAG: hypothetical protein MUF86_02905 [Akkermansiaceae bacterium]|nr:hypothetical protein [Akkermansiaceae bacterium]MCU0776597.1 hypothetical protein [Akkermansiaceae bacterium]